MGIFFHSIFRCCYLNSFHDFFHHFISNKIDTYFFILKSYQQLGLIFVCCGNFYDTVKDFKHQKVNCTVSNKLDSVPIHRSAV